MASIEEIFLAQANQAEKIQDSPIDLVPDSSALFTAKVAFDSPSKSGAWLREKLDQLGVSKQTFEGFRSNDQWLDEVISTTKDNKVYSKEELQKMYPEAEPGLFKNSNTKRFAEYIIERNKYNKALSILKDFNSKDNYGAIDTVTSAMPNFLRDIGYGAVQNLGPVDMAANAVIAAGAAYAAPYVGLGSIVGGVLTASVPQWVALGAITEGFTGTFSYLLEKQLEPKTQEEADIWQIPISVAFGAGGGLLTGAWKNGHLNWFNNSGKGGKAAFNNSADDFLKSGKMGTPEPEITRIPKWEQTRVEINISKQLEGDAQLRLGYDQELEIKGQVGFDNTVKGLLPDLNKTPTGEITPLGKLRYKVYSGSRYIPFDAEEGRWFALYEDSSPGAHHGAESPFYQSTYLAELSGDIRAYSASVKQGGKLVEIYVRDENLKIADLADPDIVELVANTIREYSNVFDNALPENLDGQTLMRFMESQTAYEMIQRGVKEALTLLEYDGIKYSTVESILGERFAKNHLFLFDGISSLRRKGLDILDGSLGALPEPVEFTFETAKTKKDLIKSEGILRNGKKIKMDPLGIFESDPFFGDSTSKLAYVEYFSANQIKEIDDAITKNSIKSIKSKYPQLKQDSIDYLKQLKQFQEYDSYAAKLETINETFKNVHSFMYLPEKDRLELYKLMEEGITKRRQLDRQFKKALKEQNISDALKAEADTLTVKIKETFNKDLVDKIVNKSVQQLEKEGRAQTIIEKANVQQAAERLNKMVEDRIGTPREKQLPQIIEDYEAKIEALAKQDPEIYNEVMKAADFCLRRATK